MMPACRTSAARRGPGTATWRAPTPGTNLKVGEALRASYSGWNDKTRQRSIPRDPRLWENIEER